jgi:hypothetical protein
MRDRRDQAFAEEYLSAKLHEIDTALDRLDRYPELAIDFEGRRRLVQLRDQLTAAVASFAPPQTHRRISVG